jgi:phage-related protein
MPSIGSDVHELRIHDGDVAWRIAYAVREAIVVLAVFKKKTGKTPKSVIDLCRRRLKRYDQSAEG